MKIVGSGSQFRVYNDDVKTFDTLPVGTYYVGFNKIAGYFLSTGTDMHVDEKVYGDVTKRVNKVLHSFEAMNRNMGVILSGNKGSGKTMFAKLLAEEGMKIGLPMLVVNDRSPSIAEFLSSIKQECIVLFDEFEKKFRKGSDDDDENQQDELLTLFDGIDDGKKLYVVTCNDMYRLSDYLLNRPGRFHYHFNMGCVPEESIREYLADNLNDEAKRWIEDVISYRSVVEYTYDILRAIVFELNQGYDLTETFDDLNIEMNVHLDIEATINLSDGTVARYHDSMMDITSQTDTTGRYFRVDSKCSGDTSCEGVRVSFSYFDAIINGDTIVIPPKKVTIDHIDWVDGHERDDYPEVVSFEMKINHEYYGANKVRHRRS